MSKQAQAFAVASVIAASIAFPVTAVAGPFGRGVSGRMPEIQEFCKELAELGETPWLSLGECVALNISSDAERHNFWVHRCDSWRDEGLLEDVGYTSYAECVHDD